MNTQLNNWLRTQDIDNDRWVPYCGSMGLATRHNNCGGFRGGHSWRKLITEGKTCNCGNVLNNCFKCPFGSEDGDASCDWNAETQSCMMRRLATQVVSRESDVGRLDIR